MDNEMFLADMSRLLANGPIHIRHDDLTRLIDLARNREQPDGNIRDMQEEIAQLQRLNDVRYPQLVEIASLLQVQIFDQIVPAIRALQASNQHSYHIKLIAQIRETLGLPSAALEIEIPRHLKKIIEENEARRKKLRSIIKRIDTLTADFKENPI